MKTTNKTILMELKNSFASKGNEFVDKLFKERGVKFKKTSKGEYNVDGDFYLEDFPELVVDGKLIIKFGKVNGSFYCQDCDGLTSLKGAPKEVKGVFNCSACKNLKSLEGAPTVVDGSFICIKCDSLTSLKGAPKEIKYQFYCSGCKNLKSLEGAPEKVGGLFNCEDCGTKFTEEEVEEICDVSSDRIYV